MDKITALLSRELGQKEEYIENVVRLLDATVRMRERFADRPFVTMAMGKLGVVTRCIVGFSGSAFTFAAAASASAPGQISADRMAAVLDLTDEIL